MTLAERIDELRRIADAIIARADSGWPVGIIDGSLKRIDATIDVLMMTDSELCEISRRYREMPAYACGITRPALVAESARRSTLSGHEHLAEVAERLRLRQAPR